MKNTFSALLVIAVLGFMQSAVFAAELIDVKPVVSGSAVSIEISADIAMTYTYYKVPGQARAVVDIAEADPEKVEPLIVVNKGVVSSISVDKAQISGIVVSRIIFNLVSESDISVASSPDRKLLTVTFGGSTAAASKPEPKPEPKPIAEPEPELKPEPKPVPPPEPPAAKVEPPAAIPATPPETAPKEEDPLGLDEPAAKPAAATPAPADTLLKAAEAVADAPIPAAPVPVPAPTVTRIPKLEPVVPVAIPPAPASALTIKDIATGSSYIEIRSNQPLTDFKATKITGPERLIVDIAGAKINQKAKTITINKFGITKARIGISPKNIRIVFDSGKSGITAHTITKTEDGLRIDFN